MTRILATALLAALALTGTASAQVGAGPAAAIAHFNQDADSQDGRRLIRAGTDAVSVSSRSGALGDVFARFNADHDGQDDVRGLDGATLVQGSPAHAADIFARVRAESAGDE